LAFFVDADKVYQYQNGEDYDYDLKYPEKALVAYEIFLLVVKLFVILFFSHERSLEPLL
jgi:hypothetical protein